MLRNTSRWSEVRRKFLPTERELNVIDVTDKDIMLEIASRNKAHLAKGTFEGKVRFVIQGVFKFGMGNRISQAEVNADGQLCETQQINRETYPRVAALPTCNAIIVKILDTGDEIAQNCRSPLSTQMVRVRCTGP